MLFFRKKVAKASTNVRAAAFRLAGPSCGRRGAPPAPPPEGSTRRCHPNDSSMIADSAPITTIHERAQDRPIPPWSIPVKLTRRPVAITRPRFQKTPCTPTYVACSRWSIEPM